MIIISSSIIIITSIIISICKFVCISLSLSLYVYMYIYYAGVIRNNCNDTENISMAPAQG